MHECLQNLYKRTDQAIPQALTGEVAVLLQQRHMFAAGCCMSYAVTNVNVQVSECFRVLQCQGNACVQPHTKSSMHAHVMSIIQTTRATRHASLLLLLLLMLLVQLSGCHQHHCTNVTSSKLSDCALCLPQQKITPFQHSHVA
jgi:hypothetical protein